MESITQTTADTDILKIDGNNNKTRCLLFQGGIVFADLLRHLVLNIMRNSESGKADSVFLFYVALVIKCLCQRKQFVKYWFAYFFNCVIGKRISQIADF